MAGLVSGALQGPLLRFREMKKCPVAAGGEQQCDRARPVRWSLEDRGFVSAASEELEVAPLQP